MAGKGRGWLTAQNKTPALSKGNLNSTSRYQPRPRQAQQQSRVLQPGTGVQAWASIAPRRHLSSLPTPPIPTSHSTLGAGDQGSVEEFVVVSIQSTILIRACGSPGPAATAYHFVLTSAKLHIRYRQSRRPRDRPAPGASQSHWHSYALIQVTTILCPSVWESMRGGTCGANDLNKSSAGMVKQTGRDHVAVICV